MNRRDFLKFLGGAAASVAIAPKALAETFKTGPMGCQAPIGPAGAFAPGFIVLEPGMSIQEAIDALPKEGGTVYVKSGTHIVNERISFPDGVRLVSEGSLTISGCHFMAKARGDAPIVFLMEEDDNVTITNNFFDCEHLSPFSSWFQVPIGDHLASLRVKMQRLCLKAKQLVT